jgi:hypothetical protein
MERIISDTDISISNSTKEQRLLRRLNESEDKTRHFFHEGASLPSGITLSSFLSKKEGKVEVEEPSHKQSAQPSS